MGDCFHLPHLRHALASLPKTLDDTYARILCNIDKKYSHYNKHVLKILQWLTFSTRPLRLEELAEVFAIDINETPRFDPGRRLPEPGDILTLCSSLITLTDSVYDASDEGSGSVLSEDSQDPDADSVAESSDSGGSTIYVRLAHFSVKEYLVSDRIQHGAAPCYSIREIESHAVLAEDCIAYILQFDEPGSLTLETLGLSPLADYAAKFWVAHAKVAEKGPIQTATVLSMKLFMAEGEGFLNWIRIFDSDDYGGQTLRLGLNDLASPIYYASLAGLFESVKMLIERSMDVNAQGGRYGNALQAASYKGHIDIVRLLLDNGADVNAQGGHRGNALQAASDRGDIAILYASYLTTELMSMLKVDMMATHFKQRYTRDILISYASYLTTELISMLKVDTMAAHFKQPHTGDILISYASYLTTELMSMLKVDMMATHFKQRQTAEILITYASYLTTELMSMLKVEIVATHFKQRQTAEILISYASYLTTELMSMLKVDIVATHFKQRQTAGTLILYASYLTTELISMLKVDTMATHFKQRHFGDKLISYAFYLTTELISMLRVENLATHLLPHVARDMKRP